jgi:ferric-dicitrate binding protein FerR (iron transport regulator)
MMMLKKEELETIERYIKGLSDVEEIAKVESLFSEGTGNSELMHLLEKDWNETIHGNSDSDTDLTYILDRIHHIIRKKEIGQKHKPVQKLLRVYMRIAAILLLPLLITGGLIYNSLSQKEKPVSDLKTSAMIYAPLGARVSFNLPDGTSGMLNSGSNLSYTLPFSNDRKVTLVGEGWFEVCRDESHPFEISVNNSKLRVLGTSFNVSAYPEEKYVEIVLKEGKVEFTDINTDKKVLMLPSERLIFKNGDITKTLSEPTKYNAWTQGKLVFKGDLMTEVARRIERWYNVKVILADPELEKYSFRATFEDEKLEDVLRLLSMTSPIRYEIIEAKLLPDETYKKEQVTIYLKK